MPAYPRKYQITESLMYHAYNRSNGGRAIFDEADYLKFVELIREYSARFMCRVYHWVIMSTHFHLLFQITDPRLISKLMAGLTIVYTRYNHNVHATNGFLWQGRFKLQPVQREQYLIACGRYIERNPVKAGICPEAEEYLYSSARFYTLGIPDGITVEDPTYVKFGRDPAERQENYRLFLQTFSHEEEELYGKLETPAGIEAFIRRMKTINGRRVPQGTGMPRRNFSIISC